MVTVKNFDGEIETFPNIARLLFVVNDRRGPEGAIYTKHDWRDGAEYMGWQVISVTKKREGRRDG